MNAGNRPRAFNSLADAMAEIARRREAEAEKQAHGKPAQDRRERQNLR
jgi:hypothetical protein